MTGTHSKRSMSTVPDPGLSVEIVQSFVIVRSFMIVRFCVCDAMVVMLTCFGTASRANDELKLFVLVGQTQGVFVPQTWGMSLLCP